MTVYVIYNKNINLVYKNSVVTRILKFMQWHSVFLRVLILLQIFLITQVTSLH